MLTTSSSVARELLERLSDARRRSDALFQVVRQDAIFDRPIPERHRIIFYLGHLEAFDWNLLGGCIPGTKVLHPEFDRLFAFGIDPVGGGLPQDQPSDWPSLSNVHEYVAQTRAALDAGLSEDAIDSMGNARDGYALSTLVNVSVEHRLMHLETLAYMFHQLPFDRKMAQPVRRGLSTSPIQPRMLSIPAGNATLGMPRTSQEFGWDNEYESQNLHVGAFEIDQYAVTNQQFLEFLQVGGYAAREYWSEDDWNWKEANGISHPVFWRRNGDQWLYRTMFNEILLPQTWPVYVSHAEATAFARWSGKQIPSEAEWHRAAYGSPDGQQRRYPWGDGPPQDHHGNFNFKSWDPAPVNAFPSGRSAFGVDGLLGNGWEWTCTRFAPLPGFQPFPFYRGYSADFFDGKHFVMKGGSARTAECMLRPTFRNWFQPHYQYVYASFRCVSR